VRFILFGFCWDLGIGCNLSLMLAASHAVISYKVSDYQA
jgi:hypothetical protein